MELTLWVGAFRYYLGRQTYAVDDFCEDLVANWPKLSQETKFIISKELENEFSKENPRLGSDCDIASWEKVRKLYKT